MIFQLSQLNRQYNKTKQNKLLAQMQCRQLLISKIWASDYRMPESKSLSLSLVPISIFLNIFSKFPPVLWQG